MSLPPILQTFLNNVGQAYIARGKDRHLLANAIRLDAKAHQDLQSAIVQSHKPIDFEKVVTSSTRIAASERIHPFLVSYLEYITQCPSIQALTFRKGVGSSVPKSNFLSAYEKWSHVYSRASLVFQSQETPYFGPTLRYIGTSLVLLAISCDHRTGDLNQPSITDAVSKISRTTGVAAIDRSPSPGEQTRRSEVLWLANASFRCYFKLKNVRLCETVLGSVENALTLNRTYASPQQKQSAAANENSNSLGMACYSRADMVTYRYYLGRLRLSQHRIRIGYNELRWAFDNCTNEHMQNKNLILSHCIVAGLILGIHPSRKLLQASGLEGPFGQLIHRIRAGDGRGMYEELDRWRDWHRTKGHYLLLKEKLEIGAWRNLMRRSFLIARLVNGLGPYEFKPNTMTNTMANGFNAAPIPQAKTPPPILKLAQFLTIAKVAWKDEQLALDDAECVVASLIDQGYVKGYLMHSSGNIVLRRTSDFGFVQMSTVY